MATAHPQDRQKQWNAKARAALVGRTIVDAFYMTPDEGEAMGWNQRAVVLCLDNGLQIIPQQDDEGNNGGSLHCAFPDTQFLLPVLR